jgi:hypothetical protein
VFQVYASFFIHLEKRTSCFLERVDLVKVKKMRAVSLCEKKQRTK